MSNNELNKINCINPEAIEYAKSLMPDECVLYDLAEFFKVFGDTTRVKILCALFETEMCVCDLSNLLNISQSAISHQLRILKGAKLVRNKKEGKIVYYSLDDDHIKSIFNQGLEHVLEF